MTPSQFKILYVCNGDNARAPLAVACTKALLSKNGQSVSWGVGSAGTEAAADGGVRPEAVRAAALLQLDITSHQPTTLTAERCEAPDLVLAMSWDQISHIWSLVPEAWEKVFTVKEFVHWAKRAPVRPPILFADHAEEMRDKVIQAHAIRKRARADFGFWGGIRPQDLNLIEPNGKGDEAWAALGHAVQALASDVITLLTGRVTHGAPTTLARKTTKRSRPKAKPKAKAVAKTARKPVRKTVRKTGAAKARR